VNNITWRLEDDGSHSVGGDILLRDVFFDPTIIVNTGGCSPIFRGLQGKQHNSPEVNIVDDLKEFVFAKKGFFGIDLLSTNMRRAREMGIPNFGTARQIYGVGTPFFVVTYESFYNFTDPAVAADLVIAYNSTDPGVCDPWLCGILESTNPTPTQVGGELGQLLHEVIRRQFERFRDGDRFWYLNNQFDSNDLAEILNTTLAEIILRNSVVQQLYCNIFEGPYGSYLGVTGPICTTTLTTTTTTGAAASTGASTAAATGATAASTAAATGATAASTAKPTTFVGSTATTGSASGAITLTASVALVIMMIALLL